MGSLDRELGTLGAWLLGIGVFLVLLDELLHLSVLGGSAEILVVAGVGLLIVNAFQVHRESPREPQDGGRTQPAPAQKAPERAVRCPSCREINPFRAAYCGACGTGLGDDRTPSSDQASDG